MKLVPLDWLDLLESGEAIPVLPTTDTGYVSYGPGRLFLPAAVNYCTNPAWAGSWSADTPPATWSMVHSSPAGAVGLGVTADEVINGTLQKVLHITYTGQVGDSNANFFLFLMTANSTFAAGESATASIYARCPSSSGTQTRVVAKAYTNAGTLLTETATTIPDGTSSWTRFAATHLAPATTGKFQWRLEFPGIATGDVVDLYVSCPMLEKSAVLTPYGDGSYPGWAWSGTANASTSTRAASVLEYSSGCPLVGTAPTSMTLAMKSTPLFASAQANFQSGIVVSRDAFGDYVYMRPWGANTRGISVYDGTTVTHRGLTGVSWAAGQSVSDVGRFSPTTVDMNTDGVSSEQSVNTTPAVTITRVRLSGSAIASIGPVVISPTRWSDADTAAFQADRARLWSDPVALYRWLSQRGYNGSLLLPLQSDSVGYIVR